ncbi:MAG: peptidoglycan bridge formation glycyltransferase FemA/FemB family protein [Spirochaetes bacterium]|nr:peptidoglycan bridge formation glycyltransferase FemA/FemB family protein [Spirochaetota bacterium]
MDVILKHKESGALIPTIILHQTSLWSSIKSRLGWIPCAFDIISRNAEGDILVLVHRINQDRCMAYVPQGPEIAPEEEVKGLFLESLSYGLARHLPRNCVFIRYDLPWETPYAHDQSRYDADGRWQGCPEPHVREMRMNFSTRYWNIRKAITDIQPPDTVIIDLTVPEDEILGRMKSKTRYNIRLAERKGVIVMESGLERLHAWYRLYLQTAGRAGFQRHRYEYFETMFEANQENHNSASIHLLIAVADDEVVAGNIVSISHRRATFLYGASANNKRNHMASYALQWETIRFARKKGCIEYDLYGISPVEDTAHPLYGLYRFKTGFGGRVLHKQGCWDYPIRKEEYAIYRASENIKGIFHQ